MHDVGVWICVRSKDEQKQLAPTSYSEEKWNNNNDNDNDNDNDRNNNNNSDNNNKAEQRVLDVGMCLSLPQF